jgi:hypothetical protein
MCGCYLRSCVHIIIHVIFTHFNILPFYSLYSWLYGYYLLLNVPIQLVLFLSRVRFESTIRYASGHYPVRSKSDKNTWYRIWKRQNPIRSVYISRFYRQNDRLFFLSCETHGTLWYTLKVITFVPKHMKFW